MNNVNVVKSWQALDNILVNHNFLRAELRAAGIALRGQLTIWQIVGK